MRQPQLLDLPIPEWLMDEAHVYLWATKAELRNAIALLEHWGIRFNEMLVWNKTWPNGQPRLGLGQNFRHTTEFILFGVRGKLRTRQAFGTGFEAPVSGEHSEKPDEFYQIVRAASYPPFGEVLWTQAPGGLRQPLSGSGPEHGEGCCLAGNRSRRASARFELLFDIVNQKTGGG